MKKILVVLIMLVGTVFVGQPAVAAEGDEAAAAVAPAPVEPEPAPAPAPAEEKPAQESPPAPDPEPAPAREEPAAPDEQGPAPADDENGPEKAVEAPEKTLPTSVAKAAPAKLEICHATASRTNPYISNSPNLSGTLNGHTGHTGPVYVVGGPTGWGDIIPPFTFGGTDYPGLNWDAAGQAIYNNGCAPVGQTPVVLKDATAVAPTAKAPTCDADGALVLPTTTGVVYDSTPTGTGPGTYAVTASPAVGYQLTNPDFETSITVLPRLTGPQCDGGGLRFVTIERATVTAATCSAAGSLVLPTTPNVTYVSFTLFGVTTVVALPALGYLPTNPLALVQSYRVPSELTGPQCDSVDVTICHRTNSNVKPYVLVTPDAAGIRNGHDTQHEGPVWDPTLKAQKIEWGDIIPPYTYNDVDYPGQNWDAAGQEIYNNGCKPTSGTDVAVTPAVTTTEVCDGGLRPTPTPVTGVVYTYTVGDGINGPWTITATASTGYEIAEDAQTVFTGDAGDESACVVPAVTTTETCDGGDQPTPTPVTGVSYEYTVGDGLTGPWTITASVDDGYFLADDAQTVFTGDAGDESACVVPAVTTTDTCDGFDSPVPTPVTGVDYEFVLGDGLSGLWVIVASAQDGYFLADGAETLFVGFAGDPTSVACTGSGGGSDDPGEGGFGGGGSGGGGDNPGATPAREEALLPDTGGVPLWLLLLGGTMTAAGVIIVFGRRPVVHAFSSGTGPAYSLTLPPKSKTPVIADGQTTARGLRSAFASVVRGLRRLLGGGA